MESIKAYIKEFMARRYMMKSFQTTLKFFSVIFAIFVVLVILLMAAAFLPGIVTVFLVLVALFGVVWAIVQKHYNDFGYRP